MIDVVIDILKDFLVAVLWWILLFPIVIVVATPIVLLVSLAGRPTPYMVRLGANYRSVFYFWSDWGIFLVP